MPIVEKSGQLFGYLTPCRESKITGLISLPQLTANLNIVAGIKSVNVCDASQTHAHTYIKQKKK